MTDNIAGRASWGVCRAEMVRCVRTLGNGNSTNTESQANGLMAPEEYFIFGGDNPKDDVDDNEFYLDAITVTRTPSTESLPEHNEVSPWNDFTSKFVVADSDMSGGASYSSSDAKGSDPCYTDYEEGIYGKGKWRLPNQKEFAMMLARKDKLEGFANHTQNNYYITRTSYSMGWHTSNYGIFGYDNGSINLTQHNRARIRCVRDK